MTPSELLDCTDRLLQNIETTVPTADGQPYDDTPDLRKVCGYVRGLVRRDDGERLTEGWLDSALKVNRGNGNWIVRKSSPLIIEIEYSGGGFWLWISHNDIVPIPVREMKTRSDVRQLCNPLRQTERRIMGHERPQRPTRKRRPHKITAVEGHPVRHEGREITVIRIKGRGRRYRLIIDQEKDSG